MPYIAHTYSAKIRTYVSLTIPAWDGSGMGQNI